jgi:excinuclease UvrABC helicase subunit UvrB
MLGEEMMSFDQVISVLLEWESPTHTDSDGFAESLAKLVARTPLSACMQRWYCLDKSVRAALLHSEFQALRRILLITHLRFDGKPLRSELCLFE